MAQEFYHRLRDYYGKVAEVLRGKADAAAIFPNPTDKGIAREQLYAEFLRQHSPSKCNVFFGGFVFGKDGTESKQLDVIVTTDTTPRFDFHLAGTGKSFAPVDGTLGVVSIKSKLDKKEIEDALLNIAAVPLNAPLQPGQTPPNLSIKGYDDWPYKIIYATDGISDAQLLGHINAFYAAHPNIPLGRRPNLVHVAGKFILARAVPGMSKWDHNTQRDVPLTVGEFSSMITDPDIQGIVWALDALQTRAAASTHIFFRYDLINPVLGLPAEKTAAA